MNYECEFQYYDEFYWKRAGAISVPLPPVHHPTHWRSPLGGPPLPRYTRGAMHNQEDKIRLIHECRTALLNRMFDELSRKPGSSAEQVSDEIITIAQAIRSTLSASETIGSPAHGLFVLALQQVVDSFVAGLLSDKAFEWLAREQQRADRILFGDMDLGEVQ